MYRYIAANTVNPNVTNALVHNNIIYGKFSGKITVGTLSRPQFVSLVDPELIEYSVKNISDKYDGVKIRFEGTGNIVSCYRGALEIHA